MSNYLDKMSTKPVVLLIAVVAIALLIDFTGLTWRLEQMVTDVEMQLWKRNAPQDIAIIAVDEKSLRTYGRWPWSRRIHASLLDRLGEVGTGPVIFDVLFADANDRDIKGDQLFADAILRHGKVVLAMSSDEDIADGVVSEVLPLSLFANAAASIGHTDMAVDKDGILRSVFLLAGTSVAHWPDLSLAALYASEKYRVAYLPGQNFLDRVQKHEGHWVRDHKILIPYSGGAGHFTTFSFSDVVDGRVADELLSGKTLFVGVSAGGLQRMFSTPTGDGSVMSGIEVHANILSALQRGLVLEKPQGLVRMAWLILLSVFGALVILAVRPILAFSSLAAALFLSALLSMVLVLTVGLVVPMVPVWLSLVAVSYFLTRRHIGGLQKSSNIDSLTGLCNRREFEEHFKNMWNINERHKRLLFLLVIDADHFKRLNDAAGHLQGDRALVKLGDYLKSKARRAGDKACRIGGEEFVILLDMDDPKPEIVERYAQEIVDGIVELGIEYADGESTHRLTVSIGCASMVPGRNHNREELFDLADQALYKAKKAGRNRIFCQWLVDKSTVSEAVKNKLHSEGT